MAGKTSFTPEEWINLQRGAMLMGMAVAAAEPSGLWGLFKESSAASNALKEAQADAGANELVRAVAADLAAAESQELPHEGFLADLAGGKAAAIKAKAVTELRQVAALLEAKAPEDAPAFKAWLLQVAERIAEAAKEGGFLGRGGVQVSGAERATLAEISDALNLAA